MIPLLALPVAALLLAATAFAGNGVAGAIVIVATLVGAVAAPPAFGIRAGRGVSAAIVVSGVAGVVVAWIEAASAFGRPDTLDQLVPVLAIVVPVAAAAMLADRGDRHDLAGTIAVTTALSVVAVLGSAWIALWWSPAGAAGLGVAGMAIAGAGLVLLAGPWWARAGRPRELLLGIAVVAGIPAGLVALLFVEPGRLSVATSAALAGVAAAVAVVGRTWVMLAVSERIVGIRDAQASELSTSVQAVDAATALANDIVADDSAADVAADVATAEVTSHDLVPDLDQGVIVATCVALLLPAVPVFVFARILVG